MDRLFGREQIYVDVEEVSADNIVEILREVYPVFSKNRMQIDYLYRYFKGDQPILYRTKDVRPEICNKVVENRASEIVSFKVGYLCGEPIQYISRSADVKTVEATAKLNSMMLAECKAAKDRNLVEWQMIGGTAYRMVLAAPLGAESPFELHTLDARNACVVRSSSIGNKPLVGVYCVTTKNGEEKFVAYTDREYFEVVGGKITKSQLHPLGFVPIIEYPANNARLGVFEPVIPVLNAINTVASNRLDGIEQFIQSIVKFINCEIDPETFAELQALGAIQIKSTDGANADVDIMTQELNQTQTQTLVGHLYQTVLRICGMPSMSGGDTADSSNNGAVIVNNGWTLAEARAKDSETMFKQSETEMLRIVLKICRDVAGLDLKSSDIEPKFTRRNYENIQTKAQVLCEMLNNEKIDPLLAFTHSGMFTDPEEAYQISMKWYERNKGSQNQIS